MILEQVPPNWELIRFSDAVTFTKKPRGLTFCDCDKIPFVPMELLPTNGLFFEQFILKHPNEISSGTYFEQEDILVAKITPSFENGKQGIIEKLPDGFGFATTEVIPFREINGKSNKFYLFYYLLRRDIRADLASKMEGTTGRQRLSKSAIERLEVLLPPLAEQRAIARVLRAVQAAREARLRELALERERKAALMEYLFTHGTRGEPTKQTEIGEMPESWKIAKVGDCSSIKTSFPSFNLIETMDTQKNTDEIILALKVSDMNEVDNEIYLVRSRLTFRYPLEKTNQLKFLRPGSIVFPKRGAAIGTNKKRITKSFSILDPNLIGVEPFGAINVHYMFAFFELFDLRSIQDSTPIPQLNKSNVENIKLPLPSIAEQFDIANSSIKYATKISSLELEVRLLGELFQAMLDELMTGRLSTAPLIGVEPSG